MSTRTPDTSVVVAGLAGWHPDHPTALEVLRARPPLIAHVLIESYSVLTRLPRDRRIAPRLAMEALSSFQVGDPLQLDGGSVTQLLERLAPAEISGGATYDALIAETARRHGVELVTLDERATRAYDAVGVTYEVLPAG